MSGPADNLLAVLAEGACLVGMGNPWRNDDAAGVRVAEAVAARADRPRQVEVVTVEDVIESYAFDIARRSPRHVVLVDAAAVAGLAPGTIVFGKVGDLEAASSGLSTHKLALATVETVFRESGKETWLLGIVPADVEFGSEISPPVAEAAGRIVNLVCGAGNQGSGIRD